MTKFNENISLEETATFATGELLEESRKEQLREAIEAGDWPADCQFTDGCDGFKVIFNRELLRREAGIVPKPQAYGSVWHGGRNRIRLSCDGNGKQWTTENGG